MFGPRLVGKRVTLAPLTEEMLPQIVAWLSDPEVTRFISLRYPPTLGGERDWFKEVSTNSHEIFWATLISENEGEPNATPNAPHAPHTRVIGTTGIEAINWPNRRATTGNLIGEKSEWGKGYGSEAVRLRTHWAFEEMGLQKLSTEAFMENIGSRRVLEKAGYKQYGIARKHEWRAGKWHDKWLADILADEWFAAQTRNESTSE